MRYNIRYEIDGKKRVEHINGREALIEWLKKIRDEKIIDIFKIYKGKRSGIEDSVLEKYIKYIPDENIIQPSEENKEGYYSEKQVSMNKKVEEGDENVYKNYVVLFMSKTTGQIGFDVFASSAPGDAKKLFEKKYRHDVYDVLSVVKKPNID